MNPPSQHQVWKPGIVSPYQSLQPLQVLQSQGAILIDWLSLEGSVGTCSIVDKFSVDVGF
jgi:hypothetical protein